MKLPVNGIIRRTYLRSVPYPNQTLKRDFSKTLRYKLKVNIYSYRVRLVLSEYDFIFNFCRGVFLEIGLQSLIMVRRQVQRKYCIKPWSYFFTFNSIQSFLNLNHGLIKKFLSS